MHRTRIIAAARHLLFVGLMAPLSYAAGACKLYDASSEFTGLCEFYAQCDETELFDVSECIAQHEEFYAGEWSRRVACADPETNADLYPEGHFEDLCSDDCQAASYDYLICLGKSSTSCDALATPPSACESLRVTYRQVCPGLSDDEPSVCGNGFPEAGEQCDDGDDDDDDICSNDCVAACGLEQVSLGPASPFVRSVSDVVTNGAGDIFVAGWEAVGGETLAIVEKYRADGSLRWRSGRESTLGQDGSVALSVDGSDNVVVVGHVVAGDEEASRAWIAKYGDAGAEIWSQILGEDAGGEPGDDAVELRGVTTGGGGTVFAVGTRRDGEGSRLWLRRFSGSGDMVWTSTYSHDEEDLASVDEGRAVTVGPDGAIFVAGDAMIEGASQRVVLLRFSAEDGVLVGEVWVPDRGVNQRARALSADGAEVFFGYEEDSDAGVWIHGVGPVGEPIFAISGPELDAIEPPRQLSGLELGADGQLMVGGSAGGRRWISRINAAGDVICMRTVELVADEPDTAAVCDAGVSSGGRPLAVGYVEDAGSSWLWLGYHR